MTYVNISIQKTTTPLTKPINLLPQLVNVFMKSFALNLSALHNVSTLICLHRQIFITEYQIVICATSWEMVLFLSLDDTYRVTKTLTFSTCFYVELKTRVFSETFFGFRHLAWTVCAMHTVHTASPLLHATHEIVICVSTPHGRF